MSRIKKWSMGLAAAVPVCGLMLAAAPASANPYLTINGSTVDTFAFGPGQFLGTYLGAGTNKLTIVIGNTEWGTSNSPWMDLSVTGQWFGGTLDVALYGDGFVGAGNTFLQTELGPNNGQHTFSSTLTTCAWVPSVPNDSPPTPTSHCGAGSLPLSSLTQGMTGNANLLADASQFLDGPYGLMMDVTITANGGVSLDDSISAVPEPGTIALFGAGLLGCALFLRRRRSNNV